MLFKVAIGIKSWDTKDQRSPTPGTDNVRVHPTRMLEHGESIDTKCGSRGNDVEGTFHATKNDVVLQGTDRIDNCSSIGLIWHAK
jgi:hypothetical protein